MSHDHPSVFIDPSGRRWRRVRRFAVGIGVVATLVALGLVISIIIPPLLPSLRDARRAVGATRRSGLITTRSERARLTARRRLAAALALQQ